MPGDALDESTRNVPHWPAATRSARTVASFTSWRIRRASSRKDFPTALFFHARESRSNSTLANRTTRKPESAPQVALASLHELKNQERTFIVEALAKTRGKIYGTARAAALLGLKPTTLSSKVHRMGLKKFVASGIAGSQ